MSIRTVTTLAALAIVLTLVSIWHLRAVSHAEQLVEARYARLLADINAEAAAAAQEALRQEQRVAALEQGLAHQIDAIQAEAENERATHETELAAARAAADSLRAQLAHRVPGPGKRAEANPAPTTAGGGASESDPGAVDVLTELLDRHARELVEVSGYADALRAAGLRCERAYSLARSADAL